MARDVGFGRGGQRARAGARGAEAGRPSGAQEPSGKVGLAFFRLIYESRDGRFCLFEDANGHLTAVNAARLI